MRTELDRKAIEKAKGAKVLTDATTASPPDKRKEILTDKKQAEMDANLKKLYNEWKVLIGVHKVLSAEELDAIARKAWESPVVTDLLWET
jgi:hypothetical protein